MISATYIIKRRGPRTEPCGMPQLDITVEEEEDRKITCWGRSVVKEEIQFKTPSLIPKEYCKRSFSIERSTVSKAAEKSRKERSETLPASKNV